ncbi:MAG: 30S ribosome-binding factor RbfA [Coriobacteriales bacterium]|nr:30S ribosome-binding factor RbfA [Coriobacteriales bacterium]
MTNNSHSTDRYSQILKEKVANIVLLKLNDKRLENVTVTGLSLSGDKGYADVFVSVDSSRYAEVQAGFESAKSTIRYHLSQDLDWRRIPKLRFHIDTTVDDAFKLDQLLNNENYNKE